MTGKLILTIAQRALIENLLAEVGFDKRPLVKVSNMLQSLPMLTGEPTPTPPFGSKRDAALALYKPPFKFEHGYIFDAENHMFADDDDVESHVAARVRGWGRIGYMPDAAELQDEVGRVIADALTAYWASPQQQQFITADDVTDEMVATYFAGTPFEKLQLSRAELNQAKQDIAAAYNAVIKNRIKE